MARTGKREGTAEERMAHKALNVLIITDLEGISGVSTIDAIPSGTELYRKACEDLVLDTNTAVSALYDGGAERVYVLDGHGSGNNFIPGMLDKRAVQVTISDLSLVIKDTSCVVLVGMHAMAGTRCAFLDHTQNSAKIHRYFYNGKRIGEMSQAAVFAGHYGVPIVAVTGDLAACKEACELFGDIPTAVVKTAVKRNEAKCLPYSEARERIYSAVKLGLLNIENAVAWDVKLPLTVEIEFNRCDYADDALENNPSLERIDEYVVRSVKTEIEGYLDVLILY